MQSIKDIFLDAFIVTSLDESNDIIEELLDIVDQVTDWILILNY